MHEHVHVYIQCGNTVKHALKLTQLTYTCAHTRVHIHTCHSHSHTHTHTHIHTRHSYSHTHTHSHTHSPLTLPHTHTHIHTRHSHSHTHTLTYTLATHTHSHTHTGYNDGLVNSCRQSCSCTRSHGYQFTLPTQRTIDNICNIRRTSWHHNTLSVSLLSQTSTLRTKNKVFIVLVLLSKSINIIFF